MKEQRWAERNGEATPPELNGKPWKWFWFDGIASCDNWTQRGKLIVVTSVYTVRVLGLVGIMLAPDHKYPKHDEQGRLVFDVPTMIAEPETMGYELTRCKGKWYGPVGVPTWSDEFMPTLATVMEYDSEQWSIEQPHVGA